MLTEAQVGRYSTQSSLRDMMIAEKEVVLTFLLQLLSERGILDRLAFTKRLTASHGASIRHTRMNGTPRVKLKSSCKSAGAKRPRCRQSADLNARRVILSCCRSRPSRLRAWRWPRYSGKKFAPAINATRRGTFMIWGCTRRGPCNRIAFVDWWC